METKELVSRTGMIGLATATRTVALLGRVLAVIPLPDGPAWDLLVDDERPSFFESSARFKSSARSPGGRCRRE
ncbi:hypothetical protein [Streptomyces wuyuanensis]|uniref:hypothetical protein n=1 Tax=Streptomyces wuyuanensis TaxID=1196353 RepID=UPI00371AB3FB